MQYNYVRPRFLWRDINDALHGRVCFRFFEDVTCKSGIMSNAPCDCVVFIVVRTGWDHCRKCVSRNVLRSLMGMTIIRVYITHIASAFSSISSDLNINQYCYILTIFRRKSSRTQFRIQNFHIFALFPAWQCESPEFSNLSGMFGHFQAYFGFRFSDAIILIPFVAICILNFWKIIP